MFAAKNRMTIKKPVLSGFKDSGMMVNPSYGKAQLKSH
jgi:hypothetical protein